MTTSYAPRGLGAAGRRLWKSVTDTYELEEHERAVLTEAARTADLCAKLAAKADRIDGTSPVLVELRQQRLALAKLLGALKVPAAGPTPSQTFRNRRPSLR